MKNKKYWILTSIVALLPVLVGLLLWNQLPDKLPTHFGADGAADGWGGKAFSIFGVPLLMLLFHWIIYFTTLLDKQNRGHNQKVLNLFGLLFPAMSVIYGVVIYNAGVGLEMNLTRILLPMLGLFFILVGNWLPKIRQNCTLGIKLPWTLYNEENWNKTHRVGGYTWVLGGLGILVMGLLPQPNLMWILPVLMVVMMGVPMVYSWRLAKRQQRQGTYTESAVNRNLKKHPVVRVVSLVLVALILTGTGVMMFTGKIDYTFTDAGLQVDASYYDDFTIPYADIDSVEYRQSAVDGTREWGFGSARLRLGYFHNDEFGYHTRYTYTGDHGCVVLTCGGDIIVLGAEDREATRELYETLLQRAG